ncbi:hypothetical protein GALL_285290 [mine drainage metagenome]|uniref:Uncharacterized protein n=1 Tax=mine drainage metagenome TaxID=410659 RepID=A0A1J5R0S1_9ZZZZ
MSTQINSRIIMKHVSHRTCDQEFFYQADTVACTLNINVEELDFMLMKWFLFIHIPGMIDKSLKRVDHYKITVTVGVDARLKMTTCAR